jgi:hypothetical protein
MSDYGNFRPVDQRSLNGWIGSHSDLTLLPILLNADWQAQPKLKHGADGAKRYPPYRE